MTFPFLIVVASWNAYAASRRPALRRCGNVAFPPLQMRHLRPLPWGPYPPRRLRSPRVTSVPCGICLPSVLPRWCRSACESGASPPCTTWSGKAVGRCSVCVPTIGRRQRDPPAADGANRLERWPPLQTAAQLYVCPAQLRNPSSTLVGRAGTMRVARGQVLGPGC